MDQTCGMIVVPLVPSYGTCPGEVDILQQLKRNISDTLNELLSGCGDGLWHRVAYLNMTNPSQQCPPACREGVKYQWSWSLRETSFQQWN